MTPSTLTPALKRALRRKAKEIKELIEQTKPVLSTRKVSENELVRRVIRRPLGAMCPGGRVRVLKRVERDRLELMVTTLRIQRGLQYEDEPSMPLDVRDSIAHSLADALVTEYHERQKKTLREVTAHVVLDSPRTIDLPNRGTRT